MAAALHGADFAMAKKVRGSMSLKALHDYASTKTKSLPKHVKKPKRRAAY
jgi:hypothetical protein